MDQTHSCLACVIKLRQNGVGWQVRGCPEKMLILRLVYSGCCMGKPPAFQAEPKNERADDHSFLSGQVAKESESNKFIGGARIMTEYTQISITEVLKVEEQDNV